nr:helix-turn-helix transcriptional regulator [Leucobacter weissii]
MSERWTVQLLADEVALSRSHLTRLFVRHLGVAPMRFLVEIRLTEFTRFIDESDLPVATAARRVGWDDARVAAYWFKRRYGVGPTQFRRRPHPSHTGREATDLNSTATRQRQSGRSVLESNSS